MTARVAVLASRLGPDDKRVLTELTRRGSDAVVVDTRTLTVEAAGAPPPCTVAFNREIGFHRAVYAAHALEHQGVTVVNSATATAVCGDKWRTTCLLLDAGLPVPRTTLALTPRAAVTAMDDLGYPAVVKPLIGSWGRLVTLVPDRAAAETVTEYIAALPGAAAHVVYVQECLDKPRGDIRVLVVGGEVVGAMRRTGSGFRTNIALGGRAEAYEPTPDIAKLAAAAADAVGADIAGVDLVEDASGAVYVLEVNHRVEFNGLQAALGDRVDVAARVVDHLLSLESR